MTYQRLPYDDASSVAEMSADCAAVAAELRLPSWRARVERARRAAMTAAPSLRYEDYPREVAKPTIEVSEAASRLAAAIHPYLD